MTKEDIIQYIEDDIEILQSSHTNNTHVSKREVVIELESIIYFINKYLK